jgi:glycosyltransferase involved in cell wall biosynthesis
MCILLTMKIAYYMPFKPLDHPHPSGDLTTGTELFNHLSSRGHEITLASRLRCRWLYYRPDIILHYLYERKRVLAKLKKNCPDVWLTYHAYYKAPDLLGRYCCRQLGIPYLIFQGIYSTKRRKKLSTRPGYLLNRMTLLAAAHVFTNKKRDFKNLKRLLPPNRIEYIAPGIHPEDFTFSAQDREHIRNSLAVKPGETVIMTAAMMRPGVKEAGVATVIDCCARLLEAGHDIRLMVAGDGECRAQLEKRAGQALGDKAHFPGRIDRRQLSRYYSGSDVFAFPGVNESLGMVYLEAQSCGLPVVAYEDWGGQEAVVDRETGLLSPASQPEKFLKNLQLVVTDSALRRRLGKAAESRIRTHHDLRRNYLLVEKRLSALLAGK